MIERERFPQLNNNHVYVDWTGAALPPEFLIDDWHQYLKSHLFGNPHSHRETASLAIDEIMQSRKAILDYLHAPEDEYEVIFTQNATNAILLLQHFKFNGGELLLTADNHNSVNGLREIARHNCAVVRYVPIKDDLTFDSIMLEQMLSHPRTTGNKLFCYPAKSNYTGTLHPLKWVERAKECGWSVLLDAAAYLANDKLDLRVVKPDFVPVSFYKMFGFPTGIGCLVIRRESYDKMYKRWFSGGSILIVSVKKDFYAPEALGYARYEDGTINFAMIPAIKAGLKFLNDLGEIKNYTVGLASALYDRLSELNEGEASVSIHCARGNDIVTFSVKKGDKIINPMFFEHHALNAGCYVRTGCFCNPGCNEKIFGYSVDAYEQLYDDRIIPDQIARLKKFADTRPLGGIRASFGYANNMSDVIKFSEVTKEFLRSC